MGTAWPLPHNSVSGGNVSFSGLCMPFGVGSHWSYCGFGNPPVTVIADDPIGSLDSNAPLLSLHERYRFGPIAFKDRVRLCYIAPEFCDPCKCPLLTSTRVASSPRFRAGAGRRVYTVTGTPHHRPMPPGFDKLPFLFMTLALLGFMFFFRRAYSRLKRRAKASQDVAHSVRP